MARKSSSAKSKGNGAKSKSSSAKSSFSHFDDIKLEVQEMVDRLYELHDETDPRKGESS